MNIAKMSIMIGANAEQALAGFKKTEAATNTFGARMAARFSTLAKVTSGGVAATATAATFGFLQGNSLVETAHRASLAGARLGEFRAAMMAAGPAAAAMESGIKNLNIAVGDLGANIITPATKALSGLGMTAGGSALESMEAFAAKVSKMESPALRMATAMQVLGDNAASLMPILERGSSAFDVTRKVAGQGGLGVDESTLTKIANAQQQLSAFWQTITTQGVVAVAPLLTELGNAFEGITSQLMAGGKIVAYGGAAAAEAWKGVALVFTGLSATWNLVVAGILAGLGKILEGFNYLGELAGVTDFVDMEGFNKLTDQWGEAFAKDGKAFKEKWADFGSAFGKVDDFFNKVEARGKVMGEKLAKNPFLENLAKKFIMDKEAMTTPLEAYQRKLSEIAAFEKNGLFAGDKGLMARMQGKAFGEFAAAINLQPLQAPGAAFKDTREAYSAIAAFERQSTRANVQDQIKALLEEGRRQNEEQIRLGREAAEALKKIAGDVVKPRGI